MKSENLKFGRGVVNMKIMTKKTKPNVVKYFFTSEISCSSLNVSAKAR